MKNFFKKIIKIIANNKYVQNILAWMAHFIMCFIYKTSKIEIEGNYQEVLDYLSHNKSLILFTWHGKIAIGFVYLSDFFKKELENGKKLSVLASAHRDGQIASAIASTFNFEIIEGSTIDPKKGSQKNKKSLTSIREMIKLIPQNRIFVFAGDGPRGPAFKINTKITNIAQIINVPIVAASIHYSKKIQLNTWDKFQIPLPFGTIKIHYSKPYLIEKNQNIDEINLKLEQELNKNL